MTREEYARRYLENTKIAPAAAAAAVLVFLAVIFGMPFYQISRELASGGKAKEGEIIRLLPSRARAARVRSVCDAGKLFGSPEEIKEYQRSAEDAQYISKAARPWVQLFLTGALRTGNEKALTGSGGELFYSEEIYSLVREDTENAKAAAKEILALDRYLKSRGVTLVALPVPGKASVYPERFSRCFRSGGVPADRALSVLSETLGREGCIVCDLSGPFMSNKNKELFLRGDTHWSEAGLSLAADELARLTGGRKPVPLSEVSVKNRGDIFDMLDLPESQKIYKKQTVTVKRPCAPFAKSEVLLLGDSYSNVYSDPSLKWGSGGGLAERLAGALGTGVDKIAINAGGASSSRKALMRELAAAAKKGEKDILSGKRYVVYEFAEREISRGVWERLDWERIKTIENGATK